MFTLTVRSCMSEPVLFAGFFHVFSLFTGTWQWGDNHCEPCPIPRQIGGVGVLGAHGARDHSGPWYLHWEDHDSVLGERRMICEPYKSSYSLFMFLYRVSYLTHRHFFLLSQLGIMSLNTHRRVGLILKPVGKWSLTGDIRAHPCFLHCANWSGAEEREKLLCAWKQTILLLLKRCFRFCD